MFNNGLSKDSNSWSNFGDYVNGVLTPFLTVINIYVFIKMTIAISSLEERRSINADAIEQARLEKEMHHEKEMLMMQLRKQEIDTFVMQMNKIFDYSSIANRIQSLQQVIDFLTSFLETGFKWFNIEDNNHTKYRIEYLTVSLRTVLFDLEDNKQSSEELFNKIYDAKAEITNTLVKAALKE
jgi:ABC-type uncharacterized transport system fused permease/ATPase subunit